MGSVDVTSTGCGRMSPAMQLHRPIVLRQLPALLLSISVVASLSLVSEGLVIVELSGPSQVPRASDIVLHCKYDLEEDRLYAVKWFRGSREFYRFEPQQSPQATVFAIDNVRVDTEASNAMLLVIRSAVPATSGNYRCEVSAEDTFETDYREINITVLDTPMGDPVIYNARTGYAIGERLDINCTSFQSRPAARLQWFINGKSVSSLNQEELERETVREEESEEREKEEEVGSFQVIDYPIRWSLGQPPLETSTTGLSATLSERHIVDADSLSIICTASLGPSYRRSTSVTAAVFKSVPPQQQHKQQQQPPQVKPSIDKRRSAHTLTGGSHRPSESLTLNMAAIFTLLSIQLRPQELN